MSVLDAVGSLGSNLGARNPYKQVDGGDEDSSSDEGDLNAGGKAGSPLTEREKLAKQVFVIKSSSYDLSRFILDKEFLSILRRTVYRV